MSALPFYLTPAGRAKLVNAQNTGTNGFQITQVGVSSSGAGISGGALVGEIKRLTTFAGDAVADDTIHITIRDDSESAYTLRAFALYADDGTLIGGYWQAGVIMEKSTQAMLLLSTDIQFLDLNITNVTFGDTNWLNPPATTERVGVLELATNTETDTGTDAQRGVTPAGLKYALDTRFGAGAPSTFVKTLLNVATVALMRSALGLGSAAVRNTGAGQGLDADLLDGQHGAFYLDYGNLTGKPSSFPPSAHGHAWGDLSGVPAFASRWPTFAEVTDKPASYPPSAHTHAAADVTAGVFDEARIPALPIARVTGLQTALDAKASASHTHAAADITTGVMAAARLGTGQAISGSFLRGDGIWANTLHNNLGLYVPTVGAPANRSLSIGSTTGQADADTQTYIDFFSFNTAAVPTWSARLIRGAGQNGSLTLSNAGTGNLNIQIDGVTAWIWSGSTKLVTLSAAWGFGDNAVRVNGAAGTNRRMQFTTALSARWMMGATTDAEGGGNTGSNWALTRYDDAGAALSNVLVVSRATGVVSFNYRPIFGGFTPWDSGNFDPANKANAVHSHTAADITSGTFSEARIPTLAIAKTDGLQVALDAAVRKDVSVNVLPPATVDWRLSGGSSEGADTLALRFVSGGSFNTTRGAILELNGANAAANAGGFRLLGAPGSASQVNGGNGSTVTFASSIYNFTGSLQKDGNNVWHSGTFTPTNIPTQTGDLLVSKASAIIGIGVSGGRNGGLANFANGGIGDVGVFSEHADGRVRLRPDGRTSAAGEFAVTITGMTWGGNAVWHAGNFNPATKANASHTHAAADITSGTLADARIPALAISKTTGLQAALDAKAPINNPTFTGIVTAPIFDQASARRFKTDITDLHPDDALCEIMGVDFKAYTLISDGSEQRGVIAEELMDSPLGFAVRRNENGQAEAVNYQALFVTACAALQALTERVRVLELRS